MADSLGEVAFTRVAKGYDPDQVDAMVNRARALLAVRAGGQGTDGKPADNPLSLLERAQTVADEAVGDATAKSERLLADARDQARRLLGEARGKADRAVADAQARADRLRGDCEHLRIERDRVAEQLRGLADTLRSVAETTQARKD